ncbi:MAG TPA: hypothetical protein DCR65_12735 [Gammaproteobacteria bacterium]|nr:hypothetical protein [Gammaproteobacteria bacterium]
MPESFVTDAPAPSLIDQLVSSYLERPVELTWARASGLPFPDQFDEARMTFRGFATAWLDLDDVVWRAEHVRFTPGLPARIALGKPRLEITVGQKAVDRWLARFELPFRLELGEDALVVHTEVAGLPLARLEARLGVDNGWFILKPQRASFLGVPNYIATLFRTYLPLPPLAGNTRLESVRHRRGQFTLCFALEDFEETITPGLLTRLTTRLVPVVESPLKGLFKTESTTPPPPRG